ncbi:hypothetical protein GW846_05175 [Candidatus Gracilibacteria bacterium]|nr:hypothetical protein [Candidatus Gracilibacteria bacterium]
MNTQSREYWEKNKPTDLGASNCPLCQEAENILYETKHWKIIKNKYPILGLDNHCMAIPKEHVIFAKDLSDVQYLDYKNVEHYMFSYFKNSDYFTFMRESLSGRSLEHLHYHFLPGQIWYKDVESMLQKQAF